MSKKSKQKSSLMMRLAKRYGLNYVTQKLPDLMYKKISPLVGSKVSEEKFKKIFDSVLNVTSGAALERGISKGLQALGVKKTIAEKAGVLVRIGVFLVI